MGVELVVDCKKLRMYEERFHPDTTFEDLTFEEREAILPELADMGAVSRAVLESSKDFEKLKGMKLSRILEKFCNSY